MIGVSETVSGLSNYPVTIACKTGTPQRSETYYVGSTRKHYTNTMMIAYGPAEDAEIALGIVIEYGGGGARAGNLVADIFNAYAALKEETPDHGRAGGRQRFGCSRGRAGRAGDRGKRRRPRRPARRLSDGAWIWQKVMKIWDFWLKNSCKKTETVIL